MNDIALKAEKKWSDFFPWLLILCLALAGRFIYYRQIHSQEFFNYPMGDGAAYVQKATEIAAGNWLGDEAFYQSPFYPYFLASVFKIFGPRLAIVHFLQIILGACGCLLLGLAARNFFSRNIGFLTGILSAFYPLAIFFDGLIQKTTFDFLFTALILYFFSLASPQKKRLFFWTGLAIGLLTLNRDNGLVYLAVLIAWIWFHWRTDPSRIKLRASLWLVAGAALILGPVCLRNWSMGGMFAVTSQFGPNFYFGNNSQANGLYQPLKWDRGDANYERYDAMDIAVRATGRRLTPAEVSGFWFSQSLNYIRQQPWEWLKLQLKKTALVWQAEEISDSDSLRIHQDASRWLDWWSDCFHFGILVPLALAGLILSWRTHHPESILFVALGMILSASVILFFIMARYRFVLVPLLLPLAAAFFPRALALFREKKMKLLGLACGLGLITALLVNRPVIHIDANAERSMAYYNLAIAQGRAGKFFNAQANFLRALQFSPGDPQILLPLAQLLSKQGRDSEALPYALAALDGPPAHEPLVRINEWGNLLLSRGKFSLVIPLYQKLLEKEPLNPWLNTQLARAFLMGGQRTEAEKHYRLALTSDPQFVPALRGLEEITKPKPGQ